MDTLISTAVDVRVSAPTPVLSFGPVVLPAPERPVDLELRVAAPATGRDLPVLLLSHGHGNSNYLSSRRGYVRSSTSTPRTASSSSSPPT